MVNHFFLLVLFLLLTSGCASPSPVSSPVAPVGNLLPSICVGDACVKVEVADSPSERQVGLMNRSFLAEDAGMLFVFEDVSIHSFWMKNTKIPLDIIWITDTWHVVEIQSMIPCTQEPCPTHTPSFVSKYALEVNAGWVEKNGIGPGVLVTPYGIPLE